MPGQVRVAESLLYSVADPLAGDWFKLGLQLGMPTHRISTIAQPTFPPTAFPRKMLDDWIARNGGEENIPPQQVHELKEKLRDKLIKVHRRDLSEMVDHRTFKPIFNDLMEHLIPDWERLGVFLGFSVSELDQMKASYADSHEKKTPAQKMLLMWVNDSRDPSYEALMTACDEIRRADLRETIACSEEFQEELRRRRGWGQNQNRHQQFQPSDYIHRSQQPQGCHRQAWTNQAQPQQPQGCHRQAWANQAQPQHTDYRSPQFTQRRSPPRYFETEGPESFRMAGADPSMDAFSHQAHPNHRWQREAYQAQPVDSFNTVEAESFQELGSQPSMEVGGVRAHMAVSEGRGCSGNVPASPDEMDASPTGPSPNLTGATAEHSIIPQGNNLEESAEETPMLPPDSNNNQKPAAQLNPDLRWVSSHMERMRKESKNASPVIVALLDSGIYEGHPDLKAAGMVIERRNFVPKENSDLQLDLHNHGTISAGILWQYSPEVKILNLKVLRTTGTGNLNYPAKALKFIKTWDEIHPNQKVDIILMPFGQAAHHNELEELIDELAKTKVILCSASNAGARTANTITFPANHGKVLAIGSCDEYGTRCPHSGIGRELTFLFPGMNIQSTSSSCSPVFQNGPLYKIVDGTSFATPHAGALVAVILGFIEAKFTKEDRIKFTNSRVMKQLLIETCHKNFCVESGYGMPEIDRLTDLFIMDFRNRHL